MTDTLFDLTLAVARELGILQEGTASGGSTSTIIDTTERTEADDFWNLGSAWITYDAGGAGAAPQGQFSVVTDHDQASKTMTLRTATTAAVAAGDRYAVARVAEGGVAWLSQIIGKINTALMDIGPIPQTDTSTITLASAQTEYSTPLASGRDLRQVWYATTTDTNDYRWIPVYNWRIQHNSTAGSQDLLILPYQYATGHAMKLVYLALHPSLAIYSDKLSDHVPKERLIYPAVLECYRYRKGQTGWDKWDDEIARWEQRVQWARINRPVRLPPKQGRLTLVGQEGLEYDTEPDKVYL